MRKIFFIAFLLTSVGVFSQTAQFGDWYFRQRIGVNKPTNNLHPNSVFEVNDSSTSSLFRIFKTGGIQSFKFKNNSAEDSILTADQFGNFKLRLKPSTVLPWDSITGKPALLISGNNLADVSNVATARTNLSVYSIATVNDSLLNHYTKSQSDIRFKSIDWFPTVANVTGLPDSLTNLQARIQTKLTKTDADTYYPAIQRMLDSLTAVQARVQTKEPFISPGTSAQYWRGDKTWQTLDKSAVGLSAVPNVDATNPVNISQSATYRFVTDSEKSTWNAKQNALGYTAENSANKATDFSTVNNTLYPTVQAVSNAISTATSSYIPLSQKGANNGVATLDVGGKVPFSQLPAALMIYKGTWNVSTNTPTLADGTGVTGWVYIVSVGGTVNTGSGSITYSAGDYAIHNGSTWEKSAGTNNVASVNGQQGVVNLTTANISESGNLYYTNARARASLSFTAGSGAYNSSTGVITIPTNTNQLTNGAGFITGFTETDPTIYAWAKAAVKPSYSYTEISSTPTTWAWANITGIPSTFTPSAHSHGNADITDVAWAKITGAPAFITGNQTITLSGDISGSGTTAITTTIGALKVTNAMLAGSIDYSKMNSATVPIWNQNTTGNAASLSAVLSSSLGGAGSVNGILKANGSGVVSAASAGVDYVVPATLSGYLPLSAGSGNVVTGALYINSSILNSNSTYLDIYNNTADGSDNKITRVGGGGDVSTARGAVIELRGNEAAAGAGNLYLSAGGSGTIIANAAIGGSSAGFSNGVEAFSFNVFGGAGGWDRAFSFEGSSGTNRGGFGAFGSDNTLGYYYIGQAFNSNIARFDFSTLVTTLYGSLSGTSASFTGTINSWGINVNPLSVGTSPSFIRTLNTGGDIYFGIEGSTSGGFFTGSTAYATVLYGNANPIQFILNGTKRFETNTNGISVTGTGTFNSSVTATSFITGGTPSNTAGYTNSIYLESAIPSITLSNTSASNGKFTLGATSGFFGIWNNATSLYEMVIDPVGSGLFEVRRAASFTGSLLANGGFKTYANSFYPIIDAARGSNFGYSSSYPVLVLGNTTVGTGAVTIGFGVDPIANSNASFSGNGNEYLWRNTGSFITPNAANTAFNTLFTWNSSGNITSPNSITANTLIKSGGTSSQFLKADGSVDANTYATTASLSSYATTASLSGYVDVSSNQYEIGGNKTFLADVVVNGKLTGARILGSTATYTSAATISSGITTAFCSNSSGSNYTLTMPSASGVTGQIMTVILTSGTLANTVTLSGINGGSYVLSCHASVVLISDGTNWKIASVYNNTAPCS